MSHVTLSNFVPLFKGTHANGAQSLRGERAYTQGVLVQRAQGTPYFPDDILFTRPWQAKVP